MLVDEDPVGTTPFQTIVQRISGEQEGIDKDSESEPWHPQSAQHAAKANDCVTVSTDESCIAARPCLSCTRALLAGLRRRRKIDTVHEAHELAPWFRCGQKARFSR